MLHGLLAEVSLNHVGMVLGLELSRLSRSNKDWHQLVDVCGIFNTLLCDQDGMYDAGDGNDRLLLGMKGAMSEFELVTLRNRLLRGMRNKAGRGEHFTLVPVGFFNQSSGQVIQDPDEQARAMIRLVFEKFAEGIVPPRRRGAFTKGNVGDLVRRLGLAGELFRDDLLKRDEWWIPDLARELGVITVKVHYWVKRGWIHHRRTPTGKHLIVWADKDELRRLRKLAGKKSSWFAAKHPDLVIPNKRRAK